MAECGNQAAHYIHGIWPDQVFPDQTISPAETRYMYGNVLLPTAKHRALITDTISENSVTILTSPTGSGKSSQIGQYLIDEGYEKVFITQPRIVAARSLAQRVTKELVDFAGESANETVGYQTAHEKDISPENKIIYVTDGVQERRLYSMLDNLDDDSKICVIVDEVHEQNSYQEVNIALIKKFIKAGSGNPNVRFVMMSATMDTSRQAGWLTVDDNKPVPIIDLPGKTYEVTEKTGTNILNDTDEHFSQGKNVLVFVPGKGEINLAISHLRAKLPRNTKIIPLHGEQTEKDQNIALNASLSGLPFVIVATNVAQTSLTIPGIDVVVDSGLERVSDVKDGVPGLYLRPISQASRDQRRGRVGREKEGIYISSSLNFDEAIVNNIEVIEIPEYDKPEIHRTRLDPVVLRLAGACIKASELDFYNQPEETALEQASRRLINIGALAKDGEVTDIGREMSRIPMDPEYSRMVVESRKYSEVVQAQVLAMVASQSYGGIRKSSFNDKNKWSKYSDETESDLILDLELLIATTDFSEEEITDLGLIARKLYKAKKTFLSLCENENIDPDLLTRPEPSDRKSILKCIISGSDEIYVRTGPRSYRDQRGHRRFLGATSCVSVESGLNMLGRPYDQVDNQFVRRYIHGATLVSTEMLQEVAPHRCSEKTVCYIQKKNGSVMQDREFLFDGVRLNGHKVEPAEPGEELRWYLISNIIDPQIDCRKLPNILNLNNVIEDLRNLQHRTSQDLGIDSIIDAIYDKFQESVPNDVVNLKQVDKAVPRITLKDIIKPEIINKIQENSPDEIIVVGRKSKVNYVNNTAFVTVPHGDFIELPNSLPNIEDREVYIRFGKNGTYKPYDEVKLLQSMPSRENRRGGRQIEPVFPGANNQWSGQVLDVRRNDYVISSKIHAQRQRIIPR